MFTKEGGWIVARHLGFSSNVTLQGDVHILFVILFVIVVLKLCFDIKSIFFYLVVVFQFFFKFE